MLRLRSLVRSLLCFPSDGTHYDLLESLEAAIVAPIGTVPLRSEGPITRLPPELLHLILSLVSSNMLSICSLVCTAWLAHARRRMFSCISISLHNADRFGRLFVSPLGGTRSRLRTSFSAHVHSIELDESISNDFWTAEVLPKFVDGFSALTALSLFGALPKSLPPVFEVVTHLELNYVHAAHPRRLEAFIAAFPRLENLKVTLETMKMPEESWPYYPSIAAPCRPPSALRRMELDSPCLLRWITSGSFCPHIEDVRLEVSRPENVATLANSLRCLSASLQNLELIVSDFEVGVSLLKSQILAPKTQLRTLRIQADHSHAANILLHLLSSTDTSLLSSLSLDFAVPYVSEPDGLVLTSLPWDALDTALAPLPALRHLAVVKVLVSPPGWRSRISQRAILLDAADRMPRCRTRVFTSARLGEWLEIDPECPPSRAAGSSKYTGFVGDLFHL